MVSSLNPYVANYCNYHQLGDNDDDQVASFCNGAILCQSMAASWASARLIAENPGEVQKMPGFALKVGFQVKRMRVSLAAWLDPQFWRWAAWFWLNSLMPGWADFNHQSHRYGAATGVLDDVDQGV